MSFLISPRTCANGLGRFAVRTETTKYWLHIDMDTVFHQDGKNNADMHRTKSTANGQARIRPQKCYVFSK